MAEKSVDGTGADAEIAFPQHQSMSKTGIKANTIIILTEPS
jgi:hypothetical protein